MTAEQIVVDGLLPGTYTSTETDPAPPFDLSAITCDDNNSTGSVANRTATFHLQAGETIKCIVRQHQAWLDHDHQGRAAERRPGLRVHDVTGTGLSSFSLDDDSDGTLPSTKTFTNIKPGSLLGHRERRHRAGS